MYFMTHDESVRHQMMLLMDSYKLELEERQRSKAKLSQQNDDNDLDNLIKVS